MTIAATTAHPDPDLTSRYGVTFVPLDELLAASDYVSLHARATPANSHLINARALAIMKRTAYLVNTTRGSLVDETALVDAVSTGRIAGAALDVLDTEPLSADSPLREVPNIVVTSHLAGQTREARTNASHAAAQDILRVLDGVAPLNATAVTETRHRPNRAGAQVSNLRSGSHAS